MLSKDLWNKHKFDPLANSRKREWVSKEYKTKQTGRPEYETPYKEGG
jgi:hypothetical protein